MKEKGFTLTELLGVITILAILALIAIPTIDKHLKEGNKELYDSQIKAIESSAQMWGTDHVSELPDTNESKTIPLSKIQQDGYIGWDLKNPKTGEPFDSNLQIKITNMNNKYKYEVMK